MCVSLQGRKKSIRYMKVRVKKETSCPLLSALVSRFKAHAALLHPALLSILSAQFNLIPLQTFEHGLLFFSKLFSKLCFL